MLVEVVYLRARRLILINDCRLSCEFMMEEEPHAHENLVAKPQQQDRNSRAASVASLTESASTQSAPEAQPERSGAAASTFLLEPMILVLLFAYNFSCKWLGKSKNWEYI